ncbi:MAG: hypothetical protein WCJ99_14315 [Betaproteobacteria bacterium]
MFAGLLNVRAQCLNAHLTLCMDTLAHSQCREAKPCRAPKALCQLTRLTSMCCEMGCIALGSLPLGSLALLVGAKDMGVTQ